MKTATLAPQIFRWLTIANNTRPNASKRNAVSLQLQAEKLNDFAKSKPRRIDQAFQSMRLNLRCK